MQILGPGQVCVSRRAAPAAAVRPRSVRSRICVSWDGTKGGETEAQRREHVPGVARQASGCARGGTGASWSRAASAPAALASQVPVSPQPHERRGPPRDVRAQASPGNSLEPSRGLYRGSQNIWLRIGRGRRGCGCPMPRLPVLPRCFLPIAGPGGLISDPRATGRTAPPPHTHAQGTGRSGPNRGCRPPGGGQASSPRQVVSYSANTPAAGRSTVLGVQLLRN